MTHGERKERKNHERCSCDADPRNPRIAFGETAFFRITHIANPVAIRVSLVCIRIVLAIIVKIGYTVSVKILTYISKAVLINIFLTGIGNRNTIVASVRNAVGIAVGRCE